MNVVSVVYLERVGERYVWIPVPVGVLAHGEHTRHSKLKVFLYDFWLVKKLLHVSGLIYRVTHIRTRTHEVDLLD